LGQYRYIHIGLTVWSNHCLPWGVTVEDIDPAFVLPAECRPFPRNAHAPDTVVAAIHHQALAKRRQVDALMAHGSRRTLQRRILDVVGDLVARPIEFSVRV
jgi:hypothetical protein